jgi:glycosyltransferase involved in cell wall biosynthesis
LRLVYPLLWSRPAREACRDQSVNTAAALARKGVDVTFLMPRRAQDPVVTPEDLRAYFEVEGNFGVVQRPSRWASGKVVPSTLWLRRAFRDPEVRGADVLYTRIPNALVLGGGSPVPFAVDHYRPWPDDWPWLRPFIRRTSRRGNCLGFVIHSHFAAGSYARCGVPPERLLVAHNGADPERMEPRLTRDEARERLSLPAGRPIAAYAGRINARKGLDRLLALAKLRPEVAFLLVGSEREGPIEQAAAAVPNLTLVPWQEPGRLAPWLYAADALLIPPTLAPLQQHRTCVLPIKLFQYLAAGRPILAPASPDTAELLRDGDNAILVPPDDLAAAAAALDRILADRPLAERLSATARRDGEALSWDSRAGKILSFLSERLEQARR